MGAEEDDLYERLHLRHFGKDVEAHLNAAGNVEAGVRVQSWEQPGLLITQCHHLCSIGEEFPFGEPFASQ